MDEIETAEVNIHLDNCIKTGQFIGDGMPRATILEWSIKPSDADDSKRDFVVIYTLEYVDLEYTKEENSEIPEIKELAYSTP